MIRIANGQGFWGDSLEAPVEQVRRGPIDYLTLDYLAEVTMSILQKQRSRDPKAGYARDFVDMIARVLPDLKQRRIRVIANAGGVNPTACKDAVLDVAKRQSISVSVSTVAGDDIMDRLDSFLERGIELKNMDTGEPLSAIR
ncbi:MAG: acyclic terpene utilization AtuA family protein, partial [Bryobacteraceae bacterium]